MKIDIPLKGGYNTEFDPEDVGSGFTVLENIENYKNGQLVKRQSIEPETNSNYLTNTNLIGVMEWIAPDDNRYYIYCSKNDRDVVFYKITNDFGTVTELGRILSADLDEVLIDNNGETVRFICGRNLIGRLYTYIKREFFLGIEQFYSTGKFYFDTTHPRDYIKNNLISSSIQSLKDYGTDNKPFAIPPFVFKKDIQTLDTLNNTYFYGYSLMFDGNQESLIVSTNINTKSLSQENSAIEGKITFNVGTNLSLWNPRITGINIYRSSQDNTASMKKILSASTLNNPDDMNFSIVRDGTIDGLMWYLEGATLGQNTLANKIIYISKEYQDGSEGNNNADIDAGFSYKIARNTQDVALVTNATTRVPSPTLALRRGVIWGQYVPILDAVQYADDSSELATGINDPTTGASSTITASVGKWYQYFNQGNAVPGWQSTGSNGQRAGYYTFLGRLNNGEGDLCDGARAGDSGDFGGSRQFSVTHRMDVHTFPDHSSNNSLNQPHKFSIMIGIDGKKLEEYSKDPDDSIEIDIAHSSVVYPIGVANAGEPKTPRANNWNDMLSANELTNLLDETLYPGQIITREDFASVPPQFKQGVFPGTTTDTDSDGIKDDSDPEFKIHWLNITGTFTPTNQYSHIAIRVRHTLNNHSAGRGGMFLYIDNFVVAKQLDTYKVYGGNGAYVSPTMDLDANDGLVNNMIMTTGGSNVINGLQDLYPNNIIGTVHKNTKRAISIDYNSGGYPKDQNDDFVQLFGGPININTGVFNRAENTFTLLNIHLSRYVVGNIIEVINTSSNNKKFKLKSQTTNVLTFDSEYSQAVNETVNNASARMIGSGSLFISNNYQWRRGPNSYTLAFFDYGLADGAYHPNPTTTTYDIGHKYTTNANGRRFLANVTLDPKKLKEEHPDWIIFSEIGQPDVTPISNFINVRDLQGGQINGIETLLGDIVVFMDNGIFRIAVPNYDPKSWSMSEAVKDVGCSAPNSIIEYNGGVFFAGKDYFYYMTPNFELIPISNSIKTDYQQLYNDDIKVVRDFKRNRLLLRDTKLTLYSFDLANFSVNEEAWTKIIFDSDFEGPNDGIFNNLDYEVYLIRNDETDNKAYIKKLESGLEYTNGLNMPYDIKTGWINISKGYNRDSILRKINLRYECTFITNVKVFTDEDDDNAKFEYQLDPTKVMQSIRLSQRAKLIKICISEPSARSTAVIKRIELEID